ncbi:MAG: c-type cytochrome domain-containing protein [Planctomycetaceae bacterium]
MLVATVSISPAVCRASDPAAVENASPAGAISYHTQIKPIFQAHCQGCHQPAKPQGQYVMTSFEALLKGGESGERAVQPGQPDASSLLEQITPTNGEALMPKGKAPLSPDQIELVRAWITQGARDDTPASAKVVYDADHPPVYHQAPVVTSLDFSPDGNLLAVAGHHEVLLHKSDGSELVARLVGVSDRIESVRFSPDGTRLAVTGGAPARMGEVQVWEVASGKLLLSVQVGYDTVYGASWSPDGTRIAFGCPDNSLRVIEAETGKEVLFQGSHADWVLDTTFSVDGSLLASVGRDQTAKLTEFETQRFIDNITSITPGALKGGLACVARHPQRDEILVGGADGVPRTYRMQRLTKRVIGDDANLVRNCPPEGARVLGSLQPRWEATGCLQQPRWSRLPRLVLVPGGWQSPGRIEKDSGNCRQSAQPEQKKQVEAYHHENVSQLAHAEFAGAPCMPWPIIPRVTHWPRGVVMGEFG